MMINIKMLWNPPQKYVNEYFSWQSGDKSKNNPPNVILCPTNNPKSCKSSHLRSHFCSFTLCVCVCVCACVCVCVCPFPGSAAQSTRANMENISVVMNDQISRLKPQGECSSQCARYHHMGFSSSQSNAPNKQIQTHTHCQDDTWLQTPALSSPSLL